MTMVNFFESRDKNVLFSVTNSKLASNTNLKFLFNIFSNWGKNKKIIEQHLICGMKYFWLH